MEEIRAYKTEDGKVFSNINDAVAHEKFLNFKMTYSDHRLYDDDTDVYVDVQCVFDWLMRNKHDILEILKD